MQTENTVTKVFTNYHIVSTIVRHFIHDDVNKEVSGSASSMKNADESCRQFVFGLHSQ